MKSISPNRKIAEGLGLILLVLISVFYYHVISSKIYHTLPYPMHVDEIRRLEPASNMLITGDFNPHYFYKASFPIYITAVGLAAGFLNSASNGNAHLRRVARKGGWHE